MGKRKGMTKQGDRKITLSKKTFNLFTGTQNLPEPNR